MVFLIAAEYVVGDVGIGYRIRIQSRILNMNVVYIYLIILGRERAVDRLGVDTCCAANGAPGSANEMGRSSVKYALEIDGVSHWFGSNKVLSDINLKIAEGQIVAIVGPSGCGKSTLLRAILGTHPPKAGRILADGQEINGPSRAVGIVYQHYTLYDFLTAQENVAFGLKLDQTSLPYRLFKFPRWRELREQHVEQATSSCRRSDWPQSHQPLPARNVRRHATTRGHRPGDDHAAESFAVWTSPSGRSTNQRERNCK